MANEILLSYVLSGNPYINIYDRTGNVWNSLSGNFQGYSALNYAAYGIAGAPVGAGVSPLFSFNFPSTVVPGVYSIFALGKIGGSFAETDPVIGGGDYQWNGSVSLPLSDLATSGQIGQIGPVKLARGTMILHFGVKLVSALDHNTPFTSGIVSGQIARDGGSFGPLQSGAFVETGLGWYDLQALTSGDLLANTAKLVFTAAGISGGTADQRDYFLVLQKTSGQ